MTRADQWKLLSVIAATVLSLWYLYPTYRYYSLSSAERGKLPPAHPRARTLCHLV